LKRAWSEASSFLLGANQRAPLAAYTGSRKVAE
jgi:hypothetical protein